jgi:hypothetical protein
MCFPLIFLSAGIMMPARKLYHTPAPAVISKNTDIRANSSVFCGKIGA